MKGLDLARALFQRENGVSIPSMTINDSAGRFLGNFPNGSEKRYGSGSTMILRSDIHDVLLDEVQKRRVDVRWNAQVQSIEEFDDGVLVCWAQNGQAEEKKVDLLIGADGTWSAVRPSMYKSLGLCVHNPEYTGLLGISILVDIDDVPGLSDMLTAEQPCVLMHGQRGIVGITLFDKEKKRVAWWTTHEAPEPGREERKLPKNQALLEIRERYSDWAFPVPQLIAAAAANENELLVWPLFGVQKLEKWHSRRTVLIGDAAHAMSPHSGQGASQALEDAAYLAYLVRRQIENTPSSVSGPKEWDWTSMLAKFQTDRQDRVNEISDEANRRSNQRREHSAFGYLMKRWIMWIMYKFMRESWGDSWYGYKVPGIDEW